MSLATLQSLAARHAAVIFGRDIAGRQHHLWCGVSLEREPVTLSGWTRAIGPVTTGPVRARTREALMLVERAENLMSFMVDLAAWRAAWGESVPLKSLTVFLIGPALEDGSPDPAQCWVCQAADEVRLAAGFMEVDAIRMHRPRQ